MTSTTLCGSSRARDRAKRPSPTANVDNMHQHTRDIVLAMFSLQPKRDFWWKWHDDSAHRGPAIYTVHMYSEGEWGWRTGSPSERARWHLRLAGAENVPGSTLGGRSVDGEVVLYSFLQTLGVADRGLHRRHLHYEDAVGVWWLTRRYVAAVKRGRPLKRMHLTELDE